MQKILAVDFLADADRVDHSLVLLRVGGAVNAGNRGHNDGVAVVEHRVGRGHAQHVEFLVGFGVLVNISIRLGQVRLGLVKIKIGDEVFDAVVREEFLQLGIQLAGQRFVMGKDQGRLVDLGDDVGNGVRFAGSGRAQKDLVLFALFDAFDQLCNRFGLIAGGLVGRNQFKTLFCFVFHKSPFHLCTSIVAGLARGRGMSTPALRPVAYNESGTKTGSPVPYTIQIQKPSNRNGQVRPQRRKEDV